MIDWPSYNQSLVRSGQVLLDFDFDVLDVLDNSYLKSNGITIGINGLKS
jgi:hypothetical protein